MTNTFDIFTGAIRALNTLSGYLNSQEKKSTGNENDIAADNVLSSNFKTKNQQHSKKVYFQKDDTKIYNSFNDFQKDKTNLHNQIERVVANVREKVNKLIEVKDELEKKLNRPHDLDATKKNKSIFGSLPFFSSSKESTTGNESLLGETKKQEKESNIDLYLGIIKERVKEVTEGIPRDYGLTGWVEEHKNQRESYSACITALCAPYDPYHKPGARKRWQNFSEMQSYIPAGEMNQVEDAKDLVKETVKCIDNIKKNLESMNVRIITLEQKEGYKPPTPKTHRK